MIFVNRWMDTYAGMFVCQTETIFQLIAKTWPKRSAKYKLPPAAGIVSSISDLNFHRTSGSLVSSSPLATYPEIFISQEHSTGLVPLAKSDWTPRQRMVPRRRRLCLTSGSRKHQEGTPIKAIKE